MSRSLENGQRDLPPLHSPHPLPSCLPHLSALPCVSVPSSGVHSFQDVSISSASLLWVILPVQELFPNKSLDISFPGLSAVPSVQLHLLHIPTTSTIFLFHSFSLCS